jgi:DNA-binding response OmpR family regulator
VNAKKHILIIEDDLDISRLLMLELSEVGFEVSHYDNGVRGLSAVREHNPDLVVLDLGLPDVEGAEIARRIRKTSTTPIIVLTAADDVQTKVELLTSGADDYLAKPFHTEELIARINVQMRHHSSGAPQRIGSMVLHPMRRQVFWNNQEINLSPREFDLLVYLSGQPGRVYSRAEIEHDVWGEDLPPSSNVVDVHIANIRSKLRDVGGYGVIRTVRGVGYAIKG